MAVLNVYKPWWHDHLSVTSLKGLLLLETHFIEGKSHEELNNR